MNTLDLSHLCGYRGGVKIRVSIFCLSNQPLHQNAGAGRQGFEHDDTPLLQTTGEKENAAYLLSFHCPTEALLFFYSLLSLCLFVL